VSFEITSVWLSGGNRVILKQIPKAIFYL